MADHCFDLVRQQDKDHFLATLFAPPDKQASLFALRAFQIEISRICDLVSESQIGEIRLQWWHDTIVSICKGEAQQHPVASALAQCIAAHHLPEQPFLSFIDAHRHDVYADAMPSLTALEAYFGQTESALIQLSCLILGGSGPEASGLGGVAYGISRMLAVLPRQQNLVPAGASVSALIELAERRFGELQPQLTALPPEVRPAFLAAQLAPLYIQKARNSIQDIENNGFIVPQWRRQWALWLASKG